MKHRKRSSNAPPSPTEGEPHAPEAQGDGEPEPQEGGEFSDDGAPDPAETAGADLGQQLAEQRDKYLRLAAEYDNYRKRTAKERLEAGSRGQAELILRMLEAIDDLSRFADIDPSSTDVHTLHKGIELVEQKLLKALVATGLEVINPVDQSFDPNLHEAITTEPALAPEDDDTVSKVFQLGYRFGGQLLRPARVVVKQWNG
ncbi:MAG: nucleotide exchange factor GrpE [Gemmatimonadaceae bacterium]